MGLSGMWQSGTKQAGGPGRSGGMAAALGRLVENGGRGGVYAQARVCVHIRVFAWLRFGAESLARLGKSCLLLTAGASSTSFSLFPPSCLREMVAASLRTRTSVAGG